MYYRETIIAGKTKIRTLKASTRVSGRKEKRKQKSNPTREEVKKVNFRNAVKKFTAKLNHNFKQGDMHLVLTYSDNPSKEEAKARLKKFIRNTRGYCRKAGIEFKWVAVTEYKNKKIHHHIVMTNVSIETINKYWIYGYTHQTILDSTGNYYKLAEYLLKETEKTFREQDSPQKKRYSCSRNIITPEPYIEKMTGKQLRKQFMEEIKPDKGYYVDQDTVRKYHHAILDIDCMEYILVSLEHSPRSKRKPKGRRGKYEKHYKVPYEEQLYIDNLIPF